MTVGYFVKSDGFKWERKHTQRAAAGALGAMPISALAPGALGAYEANPGKRTRTAVNVAGGAALGGFAGRQASRIATRKFGMKHGMDVKYPKMALKSKSVKLSMASRNIPRGKLLAAGALAGAGLGAAAGMRRAQEKGYVKKAEDFSLVELGSIAKSFSLPGSSMPLSAKPGAAKLAARTLASRPASRVRMGVSSANQKVWGTGRTALRRKTAAAAAALVPTLGAGAYATHSHNKEMGRMADTIRRKFAEAADNTTDDN